MLFASVMLFPADAGLKIDVQARPQAHVSFGVLLLSLSEFLLFLLGRSPFPISLL